MTTQVMCNFINVKLLMTFATNDQLKTISSLALLLIRVRLCTLDP